ncbi:unnamed protein product [Chironomus riparius]|uniref:Uncharacterized protein n=1 Tax=Chironomus riparius TaxID=315576 RepID=A0A9N9RK36_9DIPT|nr:unnamed protein product [Chironomus riparius]
MILLFVIFISLQMINFIDAKNYLTVDDELKDCAKTDDHLVDWSDYNLVAINDTLTVVNGSVTFLRDVISPWSAHFYAERYERGQWLMQGYVQKLQDLCTELHNQLQPWYKKFKDFDTCPIPKGTKWVFNMVPIEMVNKVQYLPPHYAGRWRIIFDTKYFENGVEKRECKMGFGNLFVE